MALAGAVPFPVAKTQARKLRATIPPSNDSGNMASTSKTVSAQPSQQVPGSAPMPQKPNLAIPTSYAVGSMTAPGKTGPAQTWQLVPGSASSSGYLMVGGGASTVSATTASGYGVVDGPAVLSQNLANAKAAPWPAPPTSPAQPLFPKQAPKAFATLAPGSFPMKQRAPQMTTPMCPFGTAVKIPPSMPCCAPSMAMPTMPMMSTLPPHVIMPLEVRRLTLPKGDDAGKQGSIEEHGLELAAVVVTVCNGNSFDDVFRRVAQQGVEGTYVATYHVAGSLVPLLAALRAEAPAAENTGLLADFHQLLEDIRSVEPCSVVFNWECCSACSDESFGGQRETETVMDLISVLLQRGHMVMCSDFSLKALIKQWSTRRLGPNPFVKLGEFGGSMHLHFDASRVAECPSAQLQRAGDLCENGHAEVHAMSQTIAYTVDHGVPALTDAYALEVLTVASGLPGIDLASLPAERTCEAAGQRGAAGHVLLRYPSGGMLLTSAGHWGELTRLDVTEERLLQTAAVQYGEEYASNFAAQLASAPSALMRSECMQTLSSQVVTQSVPCTYSTKTTSGTSAKAPFATA